MATGGTEWTIRMVMALVVLIYGQYPDVEYCSIPCSRVQHTMCKYKAIGSDCQNVKSIMNEKGRTKILSLHNSFRNALANGELRVLPPSSNMRQMYWDLELEAIAERWAIQCNASFNDECRNVNRFSVGQIMAKSKILSPSVNYYEALLSKLWFEEMYNLNQATIRNYRGEKEVKHIAQILSANTIRIGCADVVYSTVQDPKPVRVTVCNYGPQLANMEQIYRIGKACTECPQRSECRGNSGKYPHLCAELRLFDVVEPEQTFDSDAVQGEYDDEYIDNIAVKSNIFRKGQKDRLQKHMQVPNEVHGKPHYIAGGRGLEEKPKNRGNSDNGEEIGAGRPEVPPEFSTPTSQEQVQGAGARQDEAPAEHTDAGQTPQKSNETPLKGSDESLNGTTTENPVPHAEPTAPTAPVGGGSSFSAAEVLYYFIGHNIIRATTGMRP